MKLKLLLGLAVTFIGASSYANIISAQIDIGPPGLYGGKYTIGGITASLPSPISFNGQNITITLAFANDEFIRLYTQSGAPRNFINLVLNCDIGGIPPQNVFSGSATMTLLGTNISPLPTEIDTVDSGHPTFGLTILSRGPGGEPLPVSGLGSLPIDFNGVQIDLTLPDNTGSFTMQDASLFFGVSGDPHAGFGFHKVFGIGPGIPADLVPDSGTTFCLLACAVLVLVGIKNYA